MNKNKMVLGSLAMDLKRVALGYHNGSLVTARRFLDEAIKRKKEIDVANIKPYIKDLLNKLENIKNEKDKERIAEDALMYSTLFQNAAL